MGAQGEAAGICLEGRAGVLARYEALAGHVLGIADL